MLSNFLIKLVGNKKAFHKTMKKVTRYFKNELLFKMNGWNLISIVISLVIFMPIFLIVYNYNFQSENWLHIKENLLFRYLSSTIYLVLGVCVLSTIIGVGCAWFVTCHNFYGRKYLEWILILPMTIPTYIAAYSYYDILEIFNPFFNWTRKNIGIKETIMIESTLIYLIVIALFSFVLYPYIYLSARASLVIQGNRLIEAANTLGTSTDKIFSKVVFPIIRPAIIAGSSLVVMETLNDYAAVEYFGISTLTIGIFRSWFGMNDMASALKLSTYLITFVFLFLVAERFYRRKEKYNNTRANKHSYNRINLGRKKSIIVLIFCIAPFLFGFLIPVGRLFTWLIRSNTNLIDVNLGIITFNTFLISIISTIIIVFFAYVVNFSKNYFNNDILKKICRIATLGYSMPGAIIAIGVLKLNSSINVIMPFFIIGSTAGLIFAYLVRFFAVAWQPIESSMEKQCGSINQATRTLKIKAITSMSYINFPILKKPLLLTCLLVFIDITKELPLTLIIRPFNFDTLATLTYDLVNQAQFFQSSVPSLLIIFISLPAILLINRQVIS